MFLIELFLNLYTFTVLVTTGAVSEITGLYPAEQLAYVRDIAGLPESAGFMDVASSFVSRG